MIEKTKEKIIKQLTINLKKAISEGKKDGLSSKDIRLNFFETITEIYQSQIMEAGEKELALNTIKQIKETLEKGDITMANADNKESDTKEDVSRKDPELDKLVKCGKIVGYHLSTVEFEPGSGSRETDRLVLVFASGLAIKIATFCSGSAENTSLLFQTKSLLEGFDD